MFSQLVLIVATIAIAPKCPASDDAKPRDDASLREVVSRVIAAAEKVEDAESRAYALYRAATILAILGEPAEATAKWDRAASLVERLPFEKANYHNHLLTWIAEGRIMAGYPIAARADLRKALVLSRRCESDSRRVGFLDVLALQFERAGDGAASDGARGEADDLRRKPPVPGLAPVPPHIADLEKSLRKQVRSGDLRSAVRTLVAAQGKADESLRREWITTVAMAAGPKDVEALSEALAAARTIGEPTVKAFALLSVVEAQLRLGHRDRAKDAAMAVDATEQVWSMRLRMLLDVARAQEGAGEREGLDRTMKVVQAGVVAVRRKIEEKRGSDRIAPLIDLGDLLGQWGRAAEARLAYAEALKIAELAPGADAEQLPDDPAQAAKRVESNLGQSAEFLATLKARLGDLPGALAVIDGLPESGDKAYRVARLAYVLGDSGKVEVAQAWIEGHDGAQLKLDAWVNLANGLLNRRKALKDR